MELIGGGETLETLRVIIEAQTRPYQQEMARVRTVTQQATAQVEQQTQKMSKAVSKVGSIVKMALGVVGVKAIFDFGKSCVKLGSDLAEVQNVVNVTFGNMSKEVDKFAKEAIGQFGLSETMAKKYMGTYGAMAKAFGITGQAGYDMSAAITGLTGDVASFYNMSQDEAYTKLKSIFTGETESLKDLGVVMTQTALNQYALNNGFGKTTAQMTEQEKVMLRYQFVMGQLSLAQGDFQRTGGGWANQVRVLQLRFDSLKATIGQGLINALLPVIKVLNSIIERLQVAAESFKVFTEALFGKNVESTGGAGSTSQTGNTGNPDLGNNLADSTGDAAGNTGVIADNLADSAKQAQKIERALMSFDEINKLPSNDDSDGISGGITNPVIPAIPDTGLSGGILSEVQTELDKVNSKTQEVSKKMKDFLKGIKEAVEPTTKAIKKLWNEGLSKLGNFTWKGIKSFWEDFLQPVGRWMLGEKGLPRFFNITNDLLNKIKWERLLGSLKRFWQALQKPAKFVWTGLMDFYEQFLKPISIWVIGDGIPELNDMLSNLIEKINWDKLNAALKELWEALGPFAVSVGKGLISFIKRMAEILTPVISKILDGITAAIKFLADIIKSIPAPVMEAFGGALGGICTALLAFKTASTVAGVIGKIKGALSGFLGMIVAHPYVAIAVGIAALAGALVSFSKATMEDPEFDAWKNGMQGVRDAVKDSNDEIQRTLDKAGEWKDAGEAEAGVAQRLADEYFELSKKASLSNEEKERMKQIAEDLVGYVPALTDSYNSETGLITAQKDEVQKLIDKMLEQYKTEAAKDSLIEYEKARLEAYKNVSQATSIVTDASDELQKKEKELSDAQAENARQNEALGLSAASVTPEVLKLSEQVVDATVELDKNKESMISAMDEYKDAEGGIKTVTDYLYGMGNAVDDNGRKTDGLTQAYSIMIDDVGGIFENGKQVLGEKAIEIYKGIESGLYKDNGKGVYDIGNGILAQFGNSFTNGNPQVVSMAETLGRQTTEALGLGADNAKEGLKMKFSLLGGYCFEGLDGAIGNAGKKSSNIMENYLSEGIINPAKSILEINSPSKLFERFGIYLSQGLYFGFKNNISGFITYLTTLKEAIKTSVGDLYTVGKSLMQTFADGFKSIHIPIPSINVGGWDNIGMGNATVNIPKYNVTWYARGGFPENGQMFVANESGPEMVGRMGNRNVVANNNQIIAGIEAGVFRAVSNAFSSNTGEGKDMTVNVYLEGDAKALFKVVRKEGLNYTDSTGTPVFPT